MNILNFSQRKFQKYMDETLNNDIIGKHNNHIPSLYLPLVLIEN